MISSRTAKNASNFLAQGWYLFTPDWSYAEATRKAARVVSVGQTRSKGFVCLEEQSALVVTRENARLCRGPYVVVPVKHYW